MLTGCWNSFILSPSSEIIQYVLKIIVSISHLSFLKAKGNRWATANINYCSFIGLYVVSTSALWKGGLINILSWETGQGGIYLKGLFCSWGVSVLSIIQQAAFSSLWLPLDMTPTFSTSGLNIRPPSPPPEDAGRAATHRWHRIYNVVYLCHSTTACLPCVWPPVCQSLFVCFSFKSKPVYHAARWNMTLQIFIYADRKLKGKHYVSILSRLMCYSHASGSFSLNNVTLYCTAIVGRTERV